MRLKSTVLLTAMLGFAAPAEAREAAIPTLQQRVESILGVVGPGTRFGLVVATADGRELVAIAPEGRFMPASNTKIFTTAAAFATLANLDVPDADGGTIAGFELDSRGRRDLILEGRGDARLSSAPDCVTDCLAGLATAVAAKTRVVNDVIGDDRAFADDRWSPGMSWNNIPTKSGTAVSALTLDDNEIELRVTPGAAGQRPTIESSSYYSVDNRALTVAEGKTELSFERRPGDRFARLTGTITVGAKPELLPLGIDDPAYYAAWRFKALLQERGVRVSGNVLARHRGGAASATTRTVEVARLTPPPLADDLRLINKVSQNLHAELMLRRVANRVGKGSIADGLREVRAMLERAGVPRAAYDLSDGSGMSTYNRVSPRGLVALLRWVAAQPWGGRWRSTLPVGGVDGTLARRFRGSLLEGRLFAKTGTLNATNALSGYMTSKSGRTLTFSAFANDVPDGVAATGAMDAALQLIAQEN